MLDHGEYASVNHGAVEFVCVLPTNVICEIFTTINTFVHTFFSMIFVLFYNY